MRSTWVARSPSPSLNQLSPPRRFERGHEGPGFVAPAPAGLGVVDAGEGIEQGVEIGRDREPQVLEIVAGIGDDGQSPRRQNAVEAERQLGAADPARQRQHKTLLCAHRNRSCSAGRTKAAAGGSGRRPAEAAHQHHRQSLVGLAHRQPCGSGDLVGEAGFGHQQLAPEEIRPTAHVDESGQARGAEGDADRPLSPRPAKAVADDDADMCAENAGQMLPQLARRAVGVSREQQDALHPVARGYVRVIDAGVGHHKAEPVLDDQQALAIAYDPFGFAQHDLDKARILVKFGGECDRPFRRLHRRHIDIPALGLGDDFLRHDQHVALLRRQPVGGERLDRDRAEVIARLNELDAGQCLDRDFRDHQPSLARSNGKTRSA